MAYSNAENRKKVLDLFEQKRARAEELSKARLKEIHEKIPEIIPIDRALSMTGIQIFRASCQGTEGLDARLRQLREENQLLLSTRRMLLQNSGYPEDYTDLAYECPLCNDSGYVGLKMCDCMRRALAQATYESSGIGSLISRQSFENFSLDYYPDADQSTMRNTLRFIESFAFHFQTPQMPFLHVLMIGATGLGKTHLSTAAAKIIMDRGFDVIYETAQTVFSDFEYQKFHASYHENVDKTARYLDCDLLIIDDLGTETQNQFTTSCLYHLINTRINQSKSIMINTNLTNEELHKRYSDRITSRLLGEFAILQFKGRDIRALKLQRPS